MDNTLAVIVLFTGMAPGQADAQVFALTTAISGLENNPSINNGTTTTYPTPSKVSFVTKQLLSDLAVDEQAAGRYDDSTFPAGAKLVFDSLNEKVEVADGNNNILVDVSNIVSLTNAGTYGTSIHYGKRDDASGVENPFTTVAIYTFTYDDSAIGGGLGLQFALSGTLTTASKRTATKDEVTGKLTSGTGDGKFQGNALIVTGGLTLSGNFLE